MKPTKTLHLPLKLCLLIAICALPTLGAYDMWTRRDFIWAALIYFFLSLITFFIYRSDKQRALRGDRRFSENSLQVLALLGGWPGALLAQQLFRHKTRKLSFQLLFWLIVAVHLAFWCDWFLSGGSYSASVLKFLMGR